MKKILLLATTVLFFAIVHAQTPGKTNVQDAHDKYANQEVSYASTNTLPEGTQLNNGKVTLKRGYKTSHIDSNRVVVVQKPNGEVTGAFKCRCEAGSQGSCSVSITGGSITCMATGGCDCTLDVVIKPPKGIAITTAGGNWRKLIVKSNPKPEDPDQGGEIINKKQRSLPVKQ